MIATWMPARASSRAVAAPIPGPTTGDQCDSALEAGLHPSTSTALLKAQRATPLWPIHASRDCASLAWPRTIDPANRRSHCEVVVRFDLLIRGGTLVDPSTGRDGAFDVADHHGRVAAVDAVIPADSAARVIDAAGSIVTPGLVDLHTHVFRGVGYFGIDADSVASRSSVTTWVDAGSSGAFTFPASSTSSSEPPFGSWRSSTSRTSGSWG